MHLNVGGKKHMVARSTLRLQPDSMLARMFNSGFRPAHQDAEGNYYIDRDGEVFGYILDHLRDGDSADLPRDFVALRKLRREAGFFGLETLERAAAAEIEARLRSFQLSVFTMPIECSDECCKCGLPDEIKWKMACDIFEYWVFEDIHGHPSPLPPEFGTTPALVFEVCCASSSGDVFERELKRAEQIIKTALGVIGSAEGLRKLFTGIEECVSCKIHTFRLGKYGWTGDEAVHGSQHAEDVHYKLWMKLQLSRKLCS